MRGLRCARHGATRVNRRVDTSVASRRLVVAVILDPAGLLRDAVRQLGPRRCARAAQRDAGDGHGADLPREPGRQLRAGRPRLGARRRSPRRSIIFSGWPYLVGLGVGLVVAVVLGVVVEMAIVRRFRTAPRLVLTVATLGISQLMVVLSILVPSAVGQEPVEPADPAAARLEAHDRHVHPQRQRPHRDGRRAARRSSPLRGSSAAAGSASPCGRAPSGPTAPRCSGIPVARINTVVWAVAAVLAFLALFLRSGITGVPIGYAVGLPTLLLALAALVIGRLERLPTIVAMAFALGLLEQGVQWNAQSPFARLPDHGGGHVRRAARAAGEHDATRQRRDVVVARRRGGPPAAARRWPATLGADRATWTLLAAALMGVVLLPVVLRVDYVIKASALIAFAIIGMSLVVLTGWAGQISLGQMGIVGIGAAVSATCTTRWNVDLTAALAIGGVAGAVAAFAVGRAGAATARPLPRGHHVRVQPGRAVVAAQRPLLRVVPAADQRFDRLPLFGASTSARRRGSTRTPSSCCSSCTSACAASVARARVASSSRCARTSVPRRASPSRPCGRS